MQINNKNAEKTARKYWLQVWEVKYFFSLTMDEIREYYKKFSKWLSWMPVVQAHVNRKLNFLRDNFPVVWVLNQELWKEF